MGDLQASQRFEDYSMDRVQKDLLFFYSSLLEQGVPFWMARLGISSSTLAPSKACQKACQEAFILAHFRCIYLHETRARDVRLYMRNILTNRDLRLVAGTGFEPATFRL